MNLLLSFITLFTMDITEFDRDKILTEFLSDYIDGNLNGAERQSFEEYLANNEKEGSFARKAIMAKKALSRLANRSPNKPSTINTSPSSPTATNIG